MPESAELDAFAITPDRDAPPARTSLYAYSGEKLPPLSAGVRTRGSDTACMAMTADYRHWEDHKALRDVPQRWSSQLTLTRPLLTLSQLTLIQLALTTSGCNPQLPPSSTVRSHCYTGAARRRLRWLTPCGLLSPSDPRRANDGGWP